ncbi:MAG: TatD family hydrolase, partial [Halanaerobiaceae bacterium]
MFIDTHAHLDFGRFNRDRKEVIARARESGVEYIINAGADLSSSHRALELSTLFPEIYAAAGIHPHDADSLDDKALKVL